MIEGFRITMTGKALATHFRARAEHHLERSQWYEQQKEQFVNAPTAQMTNDPVQGLKEAGKRHRDRASLFQFYAEHLEPEEQYRITRHEMDDLELLK